MPKPLRMAAAPVLWIVLLFGAAGRWDWARGWVAVALYVGTMTALAFIVRRHNPTLMEARAKWRRADTKPFDKIILRILLPLGALQPAVAGLDAVRFRWSSMPVWTAYAGAFLFFLGMALITWTMSVNRFAEPTVRIQTDRGHTVVTSGPYRFIRHPMYAGTIPMYVATALVLGSLWALGLAGVLAVLLVWRTALEDRTLRRELPGYAEYAARTRYRLLPGLW